MLLLWSTPPGVTTPESTFSATSQSVPEWSPQSAKHGNTAQLAICKPFPTFAKPFMKQLMLLTCHNIFTSEQLVSEVSRKAWGKKLHLFGLKPHLDLGNPDRRSDAHRMPSAPPLGSCAEGHCKVPSHRRLRTMRHSQ
eukprot:5421119-Amphidinium_carterae.2